MAILLLNIKIKDRLGYIVYTNMLTLELMNEDKIFMSDKTYCTM